MRGKKPLATPLAGAHRRSRTDSLSQRPHEAVGLEVAARGPEVAREDGGSLLCFGRLLMDCELGPQVHTGV